MKMQDIAFGVTRWSDIAPTFHAGLAGQAIWHTQTFGDIRVRMVEYTPGYVADHWCEKGHVLLCLAGELVTELADGRSFTLIPFPNHLCLGVKPQTVLQHGKAKQQRHG